MIKKPFLSQKDWEIISEALYDLRRNSIFDADSKKYVDNPGGVAYDYSEEEYLRMGKILLKGDRYLKKVEKQKKRRAI